MANLDFIVDDSFRESLASDLVELEKALERNSIKAAHVLAGSIVESVLIDYLISEGIVERDTALTRLPLYSFDEIHPFVRTSVLLQYESSLLPRINSGLYGSIARPWSKSATGNFGKFATSYEADGATKSFVMLTPTKLNLHRCELLDAKRG